VCARDCGEGACFEVGLDLEGACAPETAVRAGNRACVRRGRSLDALDADSAVWWAVQRLCGWMSALCTLCVRRFDQEACQSGRMGLTANELSALKRTGGSNPLASATQLKRAPVAQRIEHLTTDQKVGGSNPFGRAHLNITSPAVTRISLRAVKPSEAPVSRGCHKIHRTRVRRATHRA
jgi:hypothetical protein